MNFFKRFLLWLAGVKVDTEIKVETVLDPYQEAVDAIAHAQKFRRLDPKLRMLCADTIYAIDRRRHCIPDIKPLTTLKSMVVCPPSSPGPMVT